MLLPHESTVAHEQRFKMDEPMISRQRQHPALSVRSMTLNLDHPSTPSIVSDASLLDESMTAMNVNFSLIVFMIMILI